MGDYMAKLNNKYIVEVKIKAPKVEMGNKKGMKLQTKPTLSDEEVKRIVLMLSQENVDIKELYFSSNTPIIETKQRKFIDLVELFIDRCKMRFIETRRANSHKLKI